MRNALLILLVAAAIGCSPVDTYAIRADFEQRHPGCRVKALVVGEGDSDNAYVRIKYRCGQESSCEKRPGSISALARNGKQRPRFRMAASSRKDRGSLTSRLENRMTAQTWQQRAPLPARVLLAVALFVLAGS